MYKKEQVEKKIERIKSRIIAYVAGMCIGSNMIGKEGKDWSYENSQRGFDYIDKELSKLNNLIYK